MAFKAVTSFAKTLDRGSRVS